MANQAYTYKGDILGRVICDGKPVLKGLEDTDGRQQFLKPPCPRCWGLLPRFVMASGTCFLQGIIILPRLYHVCNGLPTLDMSPRLPVEPGLTLRKTLFRTTFCHILTAVEICSRCGPLELELSLVRVDLDRQVHHPRRREQRRQRRRDLKPKGVSSDGPTEDSQLLVCDQARQVRILAARARERT